VDPYFAEPPARADRPLVNLAPSGGADFGQVGGESRPTQMPDFNPGKVRYAPRPRSLMERQIHVQRQKEMMPTLIEQGWSKEELARRNSQGVDFRSLVRVPKAATPLPSRMVVDPGSGQIFDEVRHPSGLVSRRPRMIAETNTPAFDPQAGAFKGKDAEGNAWEMDRGMQGTAENFRITSPAKDPKDLTLYPKVLPDGRQVFEQRIPNDDGGVTVKQVDGKNPDGSLKYSEGAKAKWTGRFIQGEANLDQVGRWNPTTETYDLTEGAKNQASAFATRQSQLAGAMNGMNGVLKLGMTDIEKFRKDYPRPKGADAEKLAQMEAALTQVKQERAATSKRLENVRQMHQAFLKQIEKEASNSDGTPTPHTQRIMDAIPRPDVENFNPDADLPDLRKIGKAGKRPSTSSGPSGEIGKAGNEEVGGVREAASSPGGIRNSASPVNPPIVPRGKSLTVEAAKDFKRRSGGDRAKAEQMAKDEGYSW
jgi:hypothetical protein